MLKSSTIALAAASLLTAMTAGAATASANRPNKTVSESNRGLHKCANRPNNTNNERNRIAAS